MHQLFFLKIFLSNKVLLFSWVLDVQYSAPIPSPVLTSLCQCSQVPSPPPPPPPTNSLQSTTLMFTSRTQSIHSKAHSHTSHRLQDYEDYEYISIYPYIYIYIPHSGILFSYKEWWIMQYAAGTESFSIFSSKLHASKWMSSGMFIQENLYTCPKFWNLRRKDFITQDSNPLKGSPCTTLKI